MDPFNLLDLRVSKIFGVGNDMTLEVIADIYNILNNNATTSEVDTIGSSLGRPREIINPRLLRLGCQFRF